MQNQSCERSPIILALDVASREEALGWVRRLRGEVGIFKVGMQLFYRFGPDIVRAVKDEGGEVFLDLKLHDIPNTVAHACESILDLDVYFLTIHVGGGKAMLRAAIDAVHDSRTRLLGITALTSIDQQALDEILPGSGKTPSQWALHLAGVAAEAGLQGVVCSAHENRAIIEATGDRLIRVNPGIRPAGADVQDQKRVLGPKAAMDEGANYLVIGRPILQASDPVGAARAINEEIGYAARLST